MSASIRTGGLLVLDPADKRVISFDWDSESGLAAGVELSDSAWTIAVITQSGVTALTNDNSTYVAAARTTSTRLDATTATDGDKYWVSNKITTNETPAQVIEQRFKVLVQNQ